MHAAWLWLSFASLWWARLHLGAKAAVTPLNAAYKHDGATFQSYKPAVIDSGGGWAVDLQDSVVSLGKISPAGAAVAVYGYVNSSRVSIDSGFLRVDGTASFRGVDANTTEFHEYATSFWLASNASLSAASSWSLGGGVDSASSSSFSLPMATGSSASVAFETGISVIIQVKMSWLASSVTPHIGCGTVAVWAGHRWVPRSSWLSCTGVWTAGHAQPMGATWTSSASVEWARWASVHSFTLHIQPSPGLLSPLSALAAAANESARMQQEATEHPWGFIVLPPSCIVDGCSAGALSTVPAPSSPPRPTLQQLKSFAGRSRPLHAVIQLHAHGRGFCTLYVAGELSCWGDNTAGQLGLGNTQSVGLLDTPADAPLVSVGEPVIHVSGKHESICVVTASRAVKCWGSNTYGELGRDNTEQIGAEDLPSDHGGINLGAPATPGAQVRSVEVGFGFACALWDDGAVKCWGRNGDGQLGLARADAAVGGASGDMASLGFVSYGSGQARSLFTGSHHACVWSDAPFFNCWGSQVRFMHFRSTTDHRNDKVGDNETPLAWASSKGYGQTSNLEVVSVASSGEQTWLVLSDGTVRGLGWNGGGEMGIGSGTNHDFSILQYPHVQNVVRASGSGSVCFTLVAGDIVCFGGDQTSGTGISNLPRFGSVRDVPTVSFEVPAIDSSASGTVGCALLATQEVRCWGARELSSRGLGRASAVSTDIARWQENTPLRQPSICSDTVALDTIFLRTQEPVVPVRIAAGYSHSCAIASNAKVYCFGSNGGGMAGTAQPGAAGDAEVIGDSGPVQLPRGWFPHRVSVGDAGVCIVSTGGTAMCWGTNTEEGLGVDTATIPAAGVVGESTYPFISVRGVTSTYYSDISVGSRFAMAVTTGGEVVGWGRNPNQQLGRTQNPGIPGKANQQLTVLGTIVGVASGYVRSCAIDNTGAMACTHHGVMASTGCDGVLCTAASIGGGGAVQLAGEYDTMCYLRGDGSVRCFGPTPSIYGDGAGSTARYTHIGEATVTLSEAAVQVDVSTRHACAVLASGKVQCWGTGGARLGYGHSDTIGDNELVSSQSPLQWSSAALQVAVGADHSCVLLRSGEMRCWGSGSRLGVGSSTAVVGAARRADVSADAVRFTRQPVLLDACGEIQGIHPNAKVYGPVSALDAASSLDMCASCRGTQLTSVPTWLLHVAHVAPRKGLLRTPAPTNAACASGGIDVSNAFTLTTQAPQFGVSADPWVESCVWPDGWARTDFIFVATVTFNTRDVPVESTRPAVLATLGGQSVALKGSLWALVLLDFSQGGFTVRFGSAVCSQPQLLYGDTVTCLSPPLGARDSTAGVPITIQHNVQFVPSPMSTGLNVSYAAPIIAAVQPGAGLNVTGGSGVIVRGQHMSDNEDPSQLGFLTLADVYVPVFNSSEETDTARAVGACEVANISSSEVHCSMPPGVGTVFLRVITAGQASDAISVQYAAPSIASVQPDFVVWSPNASQTADFTLRGSSFNPGFPITASIAGTSCGSTVFVSHDTLRCLGVHTSALQLSPVQAAAAVTNGPIGSTTAALVRVYGTPQITGVNPAVLPNQGGQLAITGVEFGPDASQQDGLPAAGVLQQVQLLTEFAPHPVPCGDLVYAGGSVTCTVPAGIGSVRSLSVFRQGGAVAVWSDGLRFQLPTVTAVAPDFIQQTPPAAGAALDVNITGSGFGVGANAAEQLSVRIAGVECASVHYISANSLVCRGLDTALIDPLLDVGDVVQARVNNDSAVVSRTAAVQLYGQPSLSAVRPPVLTAGGGAEVEIVGADFGPGRMQDVRSVWMGAAPCFPLLAVSSARIRCVAPSAQAGAPVADDAAADVRVLFASGFNSTLELGVSWARPEILQVVGGELLNTVPSSALRGTLFVQGLALSARGDENATRLLIAGVPCRAMGGRLLLSPDFRRVTCEDFRLAALPPAARGTQQLAFATVETDEGVQANSSLASVRIMGPPLLRLTDPAVVRQGETVRLIGDGFGWRDADLVAASIGAVTVPPSAITRTSDTSADVIVPAPVSPQLQDVTNLPVTLTLSTGFTVTLPPSENIGYDIPPAPPLTPPVQPCVYRAAGVVRAQFAWTPDAVTRVTPVAGWVVEFTTSPWFVNAFSSASSLVQTRVVSVEGATGDDLTRHNQPTPQCAAEFAIAPKGPRRTQAVAGAGAVFYDVKVLDVPTQPVWARVRANTAPSSRALDGPPSAIAGPLFDQCALQEYLATQHAARGEWAKAVCLPCPDGAVCNGLPAEAVTNAPGFARVPWGEDGLQFKACRSASMCPRGPTPLLDTELLAYLLPPDGSVAGNFSSRIPLALQPVSSQASNVSLAGSTLGNLAAGVSADDACAAGHTGLLCAQCSPGWSMADTGLCAQCPAPAVVWASLFGWTALGAVWIVALVATNLRARGRPGKPHVAMATLLMNHAQQVALASSFPLQWPALMESMFGLFSTASDVGAQRISIDCVVPANQAFAYSVGLQLGMPLFMLLGFAIFWLSMAAYRSLACCAQCRRCCGQCCGGGNEASAPPHKAASLQPTGDLHSMDDSGAPGGTVGTAERQETDASGASDADPLALTVTPKRASSRGKGGVQDMAADSKEEPLSPASSASGSGSAAVISVKGGSGALRQAGVPAVLSTLQKRALAAASGHKGQAEAPLSASASFLVSAVVALFVLHLGLTKAGLSLVTCTTVLGRRLLVADLSVDCDDPRNLVWMYASSVPALLVYGLGIPLGAQALVIAKRKQLWQPHVREVYGFLYVPYQPSHYYWHGVAQLRKVLLAVVSVWLAPAGLGFQVSVGVLVLVTSLVAHASVQPYRAALLNKLETASVALAALTLSTATTLLDSNTAESMKELATVFIVAANAVFLVTVAFLIMHSAGRSLHGSKLKRAAAQVAAHTAAADGGTARTYTANTAASEVGPVTATCDQAPRLEQSERQAWTAELDFDDSASVELVTLPTTLFGSSHPVKAADVP